MLMYGVMVFYRTASSRAGVNTKKCIRLLKLQVGLENDCYWYTMKRFS